jgi:hypothetical protein
MEQLSQEAADYCKYVWKDICYNNYFNEDVVSKSIVNYGDFLKTLVPKDTPFANYIHVQRIVYDMFMDDKILIFRFDPKDPDLTEVESFYSTNEFDDDSSEALTFVNGVRLMDESELREQITANEFTGGYWDPAIHWVLPKKKLISDIQINKVKSIRFATKYLDSRINK